MESELSQGLVQPIPDGKGEPCDLRLLAVSRCLSRRLVPEAREPVAEPGLAGNRRHLRGGSADRGCVGPREGRRGRERQVTLVGEVFKAAAAVKFRRCLTGHAPVSVPFFDFQSAIRDLRKIARARRRDKGGGPS